MIRKLAWLSVVATALTIVLALALPASAQVTSGTVSGTVKDSQGGVIPGATVVMTSETKGTKSTPVVSNSTGDFSFLNVSPDTYTVEVTMSGFKTSKRPACAWAPATACGLGA